MHTDMALRTLASIARSPKAPPSARVTAAGILLDRGWGKAAQPLTCADDGKLTIIIRQVLEDTEESPLLIEHEPSPDNN